MKFKRVFLVDTENLSDYSFFKHLNLSKQDKIILFVSPNSQRVSLTTLKYIFSSKANVFLENVAIGGKNQLDFQLSSYLGLCATETSSQYYIVSNDKGFSNSINFLKRKRKDFKIDLLEPNKVHQHVSNIKPTTHIHNSDSTDSDIIIDFNKLNKQQRLKEVKKAKIRLLLDEGHSLKQISLIMGLSTNAISKYYSEIKSQKNIIYLNTNLVTKQMNQVKIQL